MKKLKFGLFCGVAVLWMACGSDTPKKEQRDFVGSDALVERQTLAFKHSAEEVRFDRVRACWQDSVSGDGWNHLPLRLIGSFVEEDWCRGRHAERGCSGGSFRETSGSEWMSIYTLHYTTSWPEVFGLGISAGKLPKSPGWGASFSLSSNGASIVGEGLHVRFHRMAKGRVAESVALGDSYQYTLYERTLDHRPSGSQEEVLSRLVASPESLRDEALAGIDALEALAVAAIDAGTLKKCIQGPYLGDGVPPVCDYQPLDASDTALARKKLQAELGAQRAHIQTHHRNFHALLKQLVPAECFPTVTEPSQ